MNTQSTGTRRELASRSNDGLEVTLVWAMREGKDELVVTVTDNREHEYFEVPAEPAHALDVYYHPFAFREISTIESEDRRLAA